MAEENNTPATAEKAPNKLMGALSYLGILVLVPMFGLKPEEKDDYVKTHIRQGVGVLALDIVAYLIRWIGAAIIPGGIGSLVYWIGSLVMLLAFVLMILGIVHAVKPSSDKLPIFGDFFDKTFASVAK